MDPVHKKVLAYKTASIAGRISNPTVLSGHLSGVFSTSDKEEIQAKTDRMGATYGTQTLLSLLEKRGREAFPLFIKALNDPAMKCEDLAEELENEERKLRGDVDIPFRRVKSLPPAPEELMDQDNEAISPPPPYSAPVRGNSEVYHFSQGQQLSPVGKQPPGTENSNQTHQEPSSPVVPITLDSLVKDIPYSLRMRIETLMSPQVANTHDWRGLACAMNMSADEVRRMEGENNGRMSGLFDKMMHSKKTIKNLLDLLRHTDVQRLDVIDEIVEACELPKELVTGTESSEDQESDSKDFPSSVEESCKSTSNSKPLPFPRQESQDSHETDNKPDACAPSQVENDDDPKVKSQTELDIKPDARIPSQVEESEDLDTKPDARIPSQVEDNEDLSLKSQSGCQLPRHMENSRTISNDDEDDVFHCAVNEIKRHALLISCCGSSKSEKQHDRQLRELEDTLETAGWDVKYKPKCKESDLIQTVHSNFGDLRKSGVVSFVYLVGNTVHINGENYLLPADLKSPSSRADLIHSSLNINWLMGQLSENYIQIVIVDGAHENAAKDVNLNGVLKGLAPMNPLPNAVIAFPCHPGIIRKEQERLDYIQSVIKYLQEENATLDGLFDKVREELSQRQPEASSLPLEFSLTSSLFPLRLNPGDSEGLQSMSNVSCHAILVSNSKYDGLSMNTQQCIKDREKLRMALLKSGWGCEEICDKSAKEIKDELRKALSRLGDQNKWVMVYFMGYTAVIMDCNYFFGKDFTVGSAEPLRYSVPVQWALDLMCEKLRGRKILIVDDLNTCTTGLTQITAPLEVMVSLPKGGDSGQYPAGSSFTSNFAFLLENKRSQLSLEEMVQKAAFCDRHRLSSNLLHSY